ncbi:MAG: DUF4340 domain-containing protein [Flavobacteriales bacterium]|nr:DUF4340 domain-containing protein [Bacteroidota bacterium]MCB9241357.1 DUF4340 domain-containing protein [Flavobacteriales bacterium]
MFRNKQSFILLGALIVVLGILVYLRQTAETTQSDLASREFAIKSGDDISRIFMVDQEGNRIDLKRQSGNSWTVNDSFEAWQSHVDFLIDETLEKVAIKGPVPKAARDNVIRRMIITGIKVEVYTNGDEPEMVYYVGGTTPDQLGTYFKHPDDQDPFIVHIPGFNGYLNVRYSLDLDDWISRTVFASERDQIKSVRVEYPSEPLNSFKITNGEQFDVEMDASVAGPLNKGLIKTFLSSFSKLNFEGYDDSKNPRYIDSLKNTVPLIILTVESFNRGITKMTVYPKPMDERTGTLYDKDGNQLAVDADRYYAFVNDRDRLLLIQDYTFGQVFIRSRDLILPNR